MSKKTPDHLIEEAAKLVKEHGSVNKAYRHATSVDGKGKISARSTFIARVDKAVERGLLTREEASSSPGGRQAREEPLQEPLAERQARRLRDRINQQQKELNQANREINRMEDLRGSLFGLISDPLEPKKLNVNVGKGKAPPEVPVIFGSDFQWGEHIDLDQMDGLNCYDPDIAGRRYTRFVETSIDLALKSNGGKSPPRVVYLRGGDSISGEIHDELAKTNDLLSLPALRDLAMHEAGGIEVMAAELGCPIEVISVPGNHGRTTKKPESKGYVDTNYDDLLAWFLEMYFSAKDDTDVTFRSPRSGDAFFDVYETKFLLTHGDRIGSRGGQGFVGPAATIARGMKKLSDYYTGVGVHIDHILVGHFHTSLMLEHGFSNGCLAGLSEYARDLRVKPKAPTQWYFSIHPRRGMVEMREVMVGGPGEGLLCEVPD